MRADAYRSLLLHSPLASMEAGGGWVHCICVFLYVGMRAGSLAVVRVRFLVSRLFGAAFGGGNTSQSAVMVRPAHTGAPLREKEREGERARERERERERERVSE